MTFNITVARNFLGQWQADMTLPDGRDIHAVGREPGEAVARLGSYWLEIPKLNDLTDLADVILEVRK